MTKLTIFWHIHLNTKSGITSGFENWMFATVIVEKMTL